MIGYLEEEKFEVDGIVYPFKTHIQSTFGQSEIVLAHYHQHIEILYCLTGEYSLFLNGCHMSFAQGDMAVINAMEAHSVKSLSDGLNEYIVIRFEPELLYTTAQTLFEAKYILPFTMHQSTHQRIFTVSEIEHTAIPMLLRAITEEDTTKAYGFELAIRTHLGQIFLWILRRWHAMGLDLNLDSGIKQGTFEKLQPALDYVSLNFEQSISAAECAKLCAMSYSYFSRTFKQVMGRSFTDYVNYVRLSKAELLLMASDISITEIAMTLGFATTSYFIEQFKAHKQITPRQFRTTFLEMSKQK